MPWPLSQDYNEAIQSPAANFADADLKKGQAAAGALGLPIPCSGNFADVYQVRCPDGSRWAVKCFTREVPGLRDRYQEISGWLKQAKLPFTVDFSYLEQGIRVRGQWHPVLKMQWVEGLTLNQFVRQYIDKPAMLEALLQIWGRMAQYLSAASVSHCDLQHGNVLLVPGSGANSLALKLIDYDGMWTPTLAHIRSGEVGHANYQHPQRVREGIYNAEVDRFPLLLIATSLRALTAQGKALWDKYDNGENLLFKESDLNDPKKSELFRELLLLGDPLTAALTGHMRMALMGGLESAPLLDQVLPEPLPPTVSSRPSRLVTTPIPRRAPSQGTNRIKTRPVRTRSSGALRKVWIGAAAVVVVLVGGLAAWTMRGPSKPPKQTPPVVLAAHSDVEATASEKPEREPGKEDQGLSSADPVKSASATTGDDPVPAKADGGNATTTPAAMEPVSPPVTKPFARLAVPDEATLTDADKKIKVFYKEEYAKKKPEEMKTLAAKLFADAIDAGSDPAGQFALFRESRDLSAKAGDVGPALRAAEAIGERFTVDAAEMRTAAVEDASNAILPSDARANIAAVALAYADDAVEADDYATAERLMKAARTAAGSITNRSLEAAVLRRSGEIQQLRTAYATAQDAAKSLATRPDDTAANLALGKFLCLDKDDWDRGLPMLVQGNDPKLTELAAKDSGAPADAVAQEELGSRYAALAMEATGARKLHLLRRAGYWYKLAETGVTSLAHTEIVKEIAAIDKAAPVDPPAILFAAYGQNDAWTDHTIKLRGLLAQAKDQKLSLKGDSEELVGAEKDSFLPKSWVVVYRYEEQVNLITAASAETLKIPALDAKPGTPAPGQALTILFARYGAGYGWTDVTTKVQERVKGAALTVKPADLDDKSTKDVRSALVMVFRKAGRVGLSITGNAEVAVLPESANRFDAASRTVPADDLSSGVPAELINSVRMKLKLIKPGRFLIGSPNEELNRVNNEGPQHEVEISKAFYMGAFPVTVAQFAAFVKDDAYQTDAEKDGKGGTAFNAATAKWEQKPTHIWRRPGFADGDDYPVVQVSWNDATAFCAWLSKKEGKTYGLPTEAEWEYACRAGTVTRFWCGDADASLRGSANIADAAFKKKNPPRTQTVAWDDGFPFTSPVGSFKANPWGLYDMHGNVMQWCADGFDKYQEGFLKDPSGNENAASRVLRGSSWSFVAASCRSARRSPSVPTGRASYIGFRVVLRTLPKTP